MRRVALKQLMFDRGGLIALVAFAAYVWMAPAQIVDGDSAEMVTAGVAGGFGHPTGYPSYLLWLHATSWLPGASPAQTAAIATAILAGIQLFVLHAACRAWGARPIAATFAVAIYAADPVVIRYSTEAEVFLLNQLVVAAILYLAAHDGPLRGARRVVALGLVAGIGLSDHVTCVLVAPVGLLGAVRGVRESSRGALAAVSGVAALCLGLTAYLYLLIAPDYVSSWPRVDGVRGIVDHVLRRAYGGPGAFSALGSEPRTAANLAALAITLGRAWWWLPGLAGLATLILRCVRARGEPRAGWWLLALAFVLAGPVLAARFDIAPSGVNLYVVRRFHLMPMLLLAVPVAAAFELGVARIAGRLRLEVATGIAVLGFATAALIAVPALMRVRTPAFEHAAHHMLERLPPNAVVFTSGDTTFLGTGYLQMTRDERPDVLVVLWSFVKIHAYRERLAHHGLVIDTSRDARDAIKPSVRVAEQILASGRPMFVDRSLSNVLSTLQSYPYGTLFRVLPRGQPNLSIDDIAAANRDWFAGLDLDYPRPGPDDEYPTEIHHGYANTWKIIAGGFSAQGRADDAATALALANELGPTP
jgi:hypothetical protein